MKIISKRDTIKSNFVRGNLRKRRFILTGRVKELPVSEQPYRKCEEYGASVLSDAELLSVILRNGSRGMNSLETAMEILKIAGPDKSISGIGNISPEELLKIPGIGRVKIILLECLTEYSKRLWKARLKGNIRFHEPGECASYFMEDMRHLRQEEVMAVLLDHKGGYIGSKVLTRGLSDRSLISPREIFSYAIGNNASQVIVLHNHPSGDPSPSAEDINTALKLLEAGKVLGIYFADSIVIGDGSYVSIHRILNKEWNSKERHNV